MLRMGGALGAPRESTADGAAAPPNNNAPSGECFEVTFEQPVHAITPGQAAVIYDNDVLLGGGYIQKEE